MSYIVLARKYRPQTFAEVYAQEHITQILVNALEQNRVAHAYLFAGPRGVGKTSMARILAKSLNCQVGEKGVPCNHCSICEEITNGTSTDVVEIDGASNTGVDDIRELQRDLLYTTNVGRYKIYIIDEVHMLSKNAFNALLKTLEEPPANVIFIFATTEPVKVIPTIISRCQRFDFKRIPVEAIVKNLKHISQQEEIKYEEEALFQIAKKADGGMRDALSLMDQVISTGSEVISEAIVRDVFGILPYDVYAKILDAISQGNSLEVITNLHAIIEMGNDIIEIVNGFLDYLRLCLLSFYGVETGEISKVQYQAIKAIASKFDDQDLLYILSLLMKTKVDMKSGDNPALLLEIVLIKLSKIKDLVDIELVNNPLQAIIIQRNISEPITPVQNSQVTSQPTLESPPRHEYTKNPLPVPVKDEPVKKTIKERFDEEYNQNSDSEANKPKPEEKEKSIKPLTNVPARLNIDFVNEHWDSFIKLVDKEDMMLGNMLRHMTITDVSNLRFKISTENKGAANVLPVKKDKLTTLLSDYFKHNLTLEIELNYTEAEEEKELSMEAIQEEMPELAKLIKDTNAKIVNRVNHRKDF